MNRVMLIGRLTAKPELKYTASNLPYTRFTVAVNRSRLNAQGQREADFISTMAWRKQAENICAYLNKGSQVSVEGTLQTGSYTDKDGNKRYTMDVVADNVQFLDTKQQSQGRQNDGDNASPYDYQNESTSNNTNNVNVEKDPFADFGDTVLIDDNFLD